MSRPRSFPGPAAAACALVVVTAGSCAGGEAGAPLPPSPPEVRVDLREYAVALDPGGGKLPAGRFVFRVRNGGALDHELKLVRIPPEIVGPLAEQLRSSKPVSVGSIVRLAARPPGATGFFAVDLTAGRYALLCSLQDAGGTTHARKGMVAELEVPKTASPSP